MRIIKIPAFTTNYIWMIYNYKNECVIIDPGETTKLLKILKQLRLTIQSILLTHKHYDHVNGVSILKKLFPKITIYGPPETLNNGTNTVIEEGDSIFVLQKKFEVINLSGHTSGHIGFYKPPYLFCGDTIFTAGCGYFQKKLASKMYQSFLKIKKLPANTFLLSGHEYTIPNINFAMSITPENKKLIYYYRKITKSNYLLPNITPSTLEIELDINPFFQCEQEKLRKKLNLSAKIKEGWQIFFELRKRKNIFTKYTQIKY